ncbi:hypothetical protein [Noviherbaspirillum aerium]|uniref:hypothetical protein n=1 Tax=Noviherbaspirillum aerium TaxID=2588497 RepID=UPI00178C49DD|nr:hypothetical protein [Noviherbaspirillum aerium]
MASIGDDAGAPAGTGFNLDQPATETISERNINQKPSASLRGGDGIRRTLRLCGSLIL